MMERSDIIIANLTPFGGASADAGTLIEVGWFLGKGKPMFGYSNTRANSKHGCGGNWAPARPDSASKGFICRTIS